MSVDTVKLRLERFEHEHRFAFYSPKRNEIALVRCIQIHVDKVNAEFIEYKTEKTYWGASMRERKFRDLFSECLGDIGKSTRLKELNKILRG